MTPNPDNVWMAQQARNLCVELADPETFPTHILADHDTKFTAQFRTILESEGIDFHQVGPRAPNLNAFAERFVQSLKQECLDHFIVFGESHLRHIVREYIAYYHMLRPHQSLENVPPIRGGPSRLFPSPN